VVRDLPEGAMLLADKGYDANALRDAVSERGACFLKLVVAAERG
jgi:hypothetical protein